MKNNITKPQKLRKDASFISIGASSVQKYGNDQSVKDEESSESSDDDFDSTIQNKSGFTNIIKQNDSKINIKFKNQMHFRKMTQNYELKDLENAEHILDESIHGQRPKYKNGIL